MASSKPWTNLSKAPFGWKRCGRSPVLFNDREEILLSPGYDNNIYKFNTKLQAWSQKKYSVGKDGNICERVLCASIDHKQLFLFDGWMDHILLIIDVKSMKVIKSMDNMFDTGADPVIIADPYNSKLVHIMNGLNNNKHITVNIENGKTNFIYEFKVDVDETLNGGAIIFVKNKKIWLFVHGAIPIHSFDLKTRKWTNLHVNLPNIRFFGCILTSNDQYSEEINNIMSDILGSNITQIILAYCQQLYVVLFGGWNDDADEYSSDIIIYDIEQTTYKILSKLKIPRGCCPNAVITKKGDIHLFDYDNHCVISVNEIFCTYFEEQQ